jgi:mono/diheme cytochrome c family protein
MGKVFLGIILGALLVPVALCGWFWFGKVPVAVADPPFYHEHEIVSIPLRAHINRELVKNPPVQVTEDDMVAGAHVYVEKCATCHGIHGKPAPFAAFMYPAAPQLWEKHGHNNVIGVSDDPPGETYWKVYNGIRLTGMPAYKMMLTSTEIWQVSLLLATADKPLPPAAIDILRGNQMSPAVIAADPVVKALRK